MFNIIHEEISIPYCFILVTWWYWTPTIRSKNYWDNRINAPLTPNSMLCEWLTRENLTHFFQHWSWWQGGRPTYFKMAKNVKSLNSIFARDCSDEQGGKSWWDGATPPPPRSHFLDIRKNPPPVLHDVLPLLCAREWRWRLYSLAHVLFTCINFAPWMKRLPLV
jgi:hypothetical protein